MAKYVLKKDTPFYKKGTEFSEDLMNKGVILNDDCHAVANLNELDNPDEWFEMVDDKQWITDTLLDVTTNRVHVEFADDIEAIDFQLFMRAVGIVSKDEGFMTRQSDGMGWAIYLRDNGQLDITSTYHELAGVFCFAWNDDAKASIKNHPDEWKTITKYKWGK